MPIYDYVCGACAKPFEEVKGIRAYDLDARAVCPHCAHVCGGEHRDFSRAQLYFTGTSVQSPEFNPGLGCVVKNKRHKEDILKQKGLSEVGNDFGSGEKMQKRFDQQKAEEREKRWQTGLGEME